MIQKKVILIGALSALTLTSGRLLALRGTAIRQIDNYADGKVVLVDSNNKTFTIGAAGTYADGGLKPTKAFYTAATDPEIKQDTKKPTVITVYNADGKVVSEYILSDWDWRVWHVVNFLRSQDIILDKTHLKPLYKAYRRGLILKPLKMLWDFIKEVTADETSTERVLNTINPDDIKEIAEKPPTKDARLYVLPDGSIVMGSDDVNKNLDSAVQHIVSTNPVPPEGKTYADLVEDEKALHLFTTSELEEVNEINPDEADEMEAIVEEALDGLNAKPEQIEKVKTLMIESGEYSPEEQSIIESVD